MVGEREKAQNGKKRVGALQPEYSRDIVNEGVRVKRVVSTSISGVWGEGGVREVCRRDSVSQRVEFTVT